MTINERFKAVRNALGKNQSEFAEALGFAQTGISMIESHKRDVSDRHIKAICSIFNISEHWLRNGEGDMYIESDASLVDSLAKQMNMSAEQKKLMEIFLSMSDEKRDSISRAFFDFLEAARHLDAAPPAEKRVSDAERAELHRLLDEEIDAEEKARSVSDAGNADAKRA